MKSRSAVWIGASGCVVVGVDGKTSWNVRDLQAFSLHRELLRHSGLESKRGGVE